MLSALAPKRAAASAPPHFSTPLYHTFPRLGTAPAPNLLSGNNSLPLGAFQHQPGHGPQAPRLRRGQRAKPAETVRRTVWPAARPSRFAAPCGIGIKSAALIRQQSSMSTPALISAIEIASNPACGYIKQKTRRLCLQSPSFFSSAARMGTGTIRAQRMPGDTVRAGAAIFTRSGCGPERISFWQRYSCAGYP